MDGTRPVSRKRDAERTKQNILEVAALEFADQGFDGARVDAIAARTNTAKRMIYYYFSSKEELYLAVLDQAYSGIRTLEAGLELDSLPPGLALRRLIEFTFDYHDQHPNFVRLVMNENMMRGANLGSIPDLRARNSPAIVVLSALLERGRQAGLFRAETDAVDVHFMISALCFYRVSNRYTFGANFDCNLTDPAIKSRHRDMIVSVVISHLKGG
jgi:AcrR family transcriptional regulator